MKKILILLIPFLLTGCASVQYNLNINKDLNVVEEVNISATKEYFNDYYMNLPITIVRRAYNNDEVMKPIKENGYTYELRKDNNPYPSVFVSKKYDSLNDYTNNMVFKGQSFDEIFVTEDNNLINIKTKGFNQYAPDDSGDDNNRYPISDLSINISLPFVVTNNNADKYNAKTNTYIWLINEKTQDKEINITFDKTRIYIYNLYFYIGLGIFVIIVIIGLYFVLKVIRKNKMLNQI